MTETILPSRCPRCRRALLGAERWCIVHGEFNDLLPHVETHSLSFFAPSRAPLSARKTLEAKPARKVLPALVQPCTVYEAHRWSIGEPDGPVAMGRCECGATREFYNAHPDDREGTEWGRRHGRRG